MSAFDEWITAVKENHEKQLGYPPEYTEAEMYFMKDAFNAGMERAAVIIRVTNIISSANFIQVGEITEQYIKAIRKELDK